MKMPSRFELTEDHLKLLRRLDILWDDSAYDGAPSVDIKRPFGNSGVWEDIAEILGWDQVPLVGGDKGWPEGTDEKAMSLYRELEYALQIVLKTGSFVAGTYVCTSYMRNWSIEKQ